MGLADLCTLFFLRASEICRPKGSASAPLQPRRSLKAVKEVGLDQLRRLGWHVRRAVRATAWPGEASLVILQNLAVDVWWAGALLTTAPSSQSLPIYER